MFKLRVADAKLLRDMVTAISTLVDEATFDLTPDGIRLRAMDPSRVAMVDFEWAKSIFDEYECLEPTKLCVNISELLKLLRRAERDEPVDLALDEKTARLQTRIRGKYTRTFNMPTLEAVEEEVPIERLQQLPFTVKAEVTTEGLRRALEDASLVSDHVRIEADSEKVTIRATGDLMGADIELKRGEDALLSLEAKEPTQATYGLSYLSEIVKAAAATSEIATVEFASNIPIRLDFKQAQEGRLTYYLAPRIEAE